MNNPKPLMRIETIKEYKDVAETLYKIVAGATPSGSKEKPRSPMFDALTPGKKQIEEREEEEITIDNVMDIEPIKKDV
jgi:hypothetical protein